MGGGLSEVFMSPTLLLSELFPPRVGGTSTWFYQVYRRYPRGNVAVLTDSHPEGAAFDAQSDLRIWRVPMRMEDWGFLRPWSAGRYWRLASRAWRLVRQERVQAIHCARVMPEGVVGFVLWSLARVPYLIYAHGEEIGTALTSWQLAFLMRRAYGSAKFIVANSEHTSGLLRAVGVPDSKIVIIHPGVDADLFHPTDDRTDPQKSLGLNGHKVLLSVGRLQRRKGHDTVIKALSIIAREIPDVTYVIVGTGEEEMRLRRLAEEVGVAHAVRFFGRVTDEQLPEYYRACDVFVMPNREEVNQDIEGFGIVFLEANACGKPVIAGRSGGTGEAIAEGETGLRVNGDDHREVAEAVLSLLRNPARALEMGRKGRMRALAEFRWDFIAKKIRELKL